MSYSSIHTLCMLYIHLGQNPNWIYTKGPLAPKCLIRFTCKLALMQLLANMTRHKSVFYLWCDMQTSFLGSCLKITSTKIPPKQKYHKLITKIRIFLAICKNPGAWRSTAAAGDHYEHSFYPRTGTPFSYNIISFWIYEVIGDPFVWVIQLDVAVLEREH